MEIKEITDPQKFKLKCLEMYQESITNFMDKCKPLLIPKLPNIQSTKDPPTLVQLCMSTLKNNSERIVSFDGVPPVLCNWISDELCDSNLMNAHLFPLLVKDKKPSEIWVKDVSWMTHQQLLRAMRSINTRNLETLKLDNCGDCFDEEVAIVLLSRPMDKLHTLSIKGCRGLTPLMMMGFATLASLTSLDLGGCYIPYMPNIFRMLTKVKSLSLDGCQFQDISMLNQISKLHILCLRRLPQLYDNDLINVTRSNCDLLELNLSDSCFITDRGMLSVAQNCPKIHTLRISNMYLHKSLAYLSFGIKKIRVLDLSNQFYIPDAELGVYIDCSGDFFTSLNLQRTSSSVFMAHAIAFSCHNLKDLNLANCEDFTDRQVSIVVEKCRSLERLDISGCAVEGRRWPSTSLLKIIRD